VLGLAGVGVSFSDPDARGASLQLNVSVNIGLLRFAYPMPDDMRTLLSAYGTLPLSRSDYSLLAPASNLTSLLTFLTFLPPVDYTGAASLLLSRSDRGNSGLGGALRVSSSMPIRVQRLNQQISASVTTGPSSTPITLDGPVSMTRAHYLANLTQDKPFRF